LKSFLKIALGIVTSMAGFLEVGSISTAAQAGAAFRFRLLWAIAAATICLVALVEMSGRLAASSRHTVSDAVRERFGFRFSAVPLAAEIVLDTLVLAAELGGAAIAVELATSVGRGWWVLPAAFATCAARIALSIAAIACARMPLPPRRRSPACSTNSTCTSSRSSSGPASGCWASWRHCRTSRR